MTVRVRWLGVVDYDEALALQEQLVLGDYDHLLLLEHPAIYTLGVNADPANVLADPERLELERGVRIQRTSRGGDVTFHGPGQVVGYPILTLPGQRGGGLAETRAYVESIEALLIATLARVGLAGRRRRGFPGVWVGGDDEPWRKIAAIGVRLSRNRTMHGFALNHDVDLGWFDEIVPCGIADGEVTSLEKEGVSITRRELVDLLAEEVVTHLTPGREVERQDVVWRRTGTGDADLAPFSRGAGPGDVIRPERGATPVSVGTRTGQRLDEAGVGTGLDLSARKPEWMRVRLQTSDELYRLKSLSRSLGLTTVCEEAGCPNLSECWSDGTATFMLLGERCTRACGFCLIDTRKPAAPDPSEPERVADAVAELDLNYAVLTMVARDDLDDGGAAIVAETVEAIRRRDPATGVEVLISDLRGSLPALKTVLAAEPTVLNHNVETVARLQRAVRPSASYGRSLSVLARAKKRGAVTKSGLMVGLGETWEELAATLADLAAIGTDIVTVGQYLRPTTNHLPVQRWWSPDEFDQIGELGRSLGIRWVEASPLTRSSHHADVAANAVAGQYEASH